MVEVITVKDGELTVNLKVKDGYYIQTQITYKDVIQSNSIMEFKYDSDPAVNTWVPLRLLPDQESPDSLQNLLNLTKFVKYLPLVIPPPLREITHYPEFEPIYKCVNGLIELNPQTPVNDYLAFIDECRIYNARIINLFGGLDRIRQLPVLTLPKDQYPIRNDYIDYLNIDDLSAPLMRGVVNKDRPFIACRYRSGSRVWVEVCHQRYSGCGEYEDWTCGQSGYGHEIDANYPRMWCSSRYDPEQISYRVQFDRIGRLLRGEPVGTIVVSDQTRYESRYVESPIRTNKNGISVVQLM
jgi:hypothetical protein